jgi:hypothetical protein
MDPNTAFRLKRIRSDPDRIRGMPVTGRVSTINEGIRYVYECNNCCHNLYITCWGQKKASYPDITNHKRTQCECGGRKDWKFLEYKRVSR